MKTNCQEKKTKKKKEQEKKTKQKKEKKTSVKTNSETCQKTMSVIASHVKRMKMETNTKNKKSFPKDLCNQEEVQTQNSYT